MHAMLTRDRTIGTSAMPNGMYMVEFSDAEGVLLARRQLMVQH